jgi:hypothetical protein
MWILLATKSLKEALIRHRGRRRVLDNLDNEPSPSYEREGSHHSALATLE